MKRIDLIKKITLKFGGANSSWYAKLNGNRKVDIKTALKLKDEFNIPLEAWENSEIFSKTMKGVTNIPKRGRKRKDRE
ncbi:hypothetical protein ACT6B6_01305 [Campylobacter coli]|uniref:hypothetical protein n=1 Tax=Campylobacter coli TaxID=195 RepID=UPI0040345490